MAGRGGRTVQAKAGNQWQVSSEFDSNPLSLRLGEQVRQRGLSLGLTQAKLAVLGAFGL